VITVTVLCPHGLQILSNTSHYETIKLKEGDTSVHSVSLCRYKYQLNRKESDRKHFHSFIHQWLYSYFLRPSRIFSFLILYTDSRTPWTRDQPVARPLPTHRTELAHRDIHASSGIRTHDPSVRASEDSPCLRLRGHCDRCDRKQ
jgi:hypothetical protein